MLWISMSKYEKYIKHIFIFIVFINMLIKKIIKKFDFEKKFRKYQILYVLQCYSN